MSWESVGWARASHTCGSRFPGLGERVYRLAQGADSAAALVTEDGIVAAAAEERFVRRKPCRVPAGRDRVCARRGWRTPPRDVSAIAHNFDFGRYQTYFESEGAIKEYQNVYAPEVIQRDLFAAFPRDLWGDDLKVIPILHHQAHAASALHCSGFGSADVLVADGIGEFESTSLYTGGSQGLRLRGQVGGLHSIGLVYGLVTMHLGFWMNFDEYKVMGLAPYGDRRRFRSAFDTLVVRQNDGRYTTPLTYMNETPQERATYQKSREHLASVLGPPREPMRASSSVTSTSPRRCRP